MKARTYLLVSPVAAAVLALCAPGYALPERSAAAAEASLKHSSATHLPGATKAVMLSVARAGNRIVAVGDHGVVLLSDDDGAGFRQAKSVPTRVPLTGVTFVDGKEGWACGHWGTVLHTTDGGETWSMVRTDTTADQPLFSIWFHDNQNGIAVGLWSLMLSTQDGGKTWRQVKLPPPPGSAKADKNLYQIFSDGKGLLIAAAEQGYIYRSTDSGASWEAVATGNKGTFWTGAILSDGEILVAGLGGAMYHSADGGKTWTPVDTGTKSSITAMTQLPDGRIFAVGLDGTSLSSSDHNLAFSATQREDRLSLTAITVNERGTPVIFSKLGPLNDLK